MGDANQTLVGIGKDITIEVVRVERNKRYDCKKLAKDYGCANDLCSEKRHFLINPSAMKNLCATEIEVVIINTSTKVFHYHFSYFSMIDTNSFSYQANEPLCSILRFGRYEYFGCDIQPSSQVKAIICFPELEENVDVHKVCFQCGNQTIDIPIATLSDTAQRKLASLSAQSKSNALANRLKQAIDILDELIFQRLNNILTRSEKIRLENQIMNSEFEIKKQFGELNDLDRKELEDILSVLMSDYHERLIPANGDKKEVWERIAKEGVREDLGDTVFRSSWEANIARILNSKKIHWEYETTPFMIDATPYLPDFFLDDGTILEVKGRWDNESLVKVESFIRLHPETNFLIVDHDMCPDLTALYGDSLPNWEKVPVQREKVNVVIVGIAFAPDKTVIKRLGNSDTLIMEYEPNNEYDPYAVVVKTVNGNVVGHIEKRFAPIYCQKLKLGMTFSLEITSVEAKIIRAKAYRTNWDSYVVHTILDCPHPAVKKEDMQSVTSGSFSAIKSHRFSIGDTVHHRKFGRGIILAVSRNCYTIKFEDEIKDIAIGFEDEVFL